MADNTSPTFSGSLDGTPTYIEDGAAVVLDSSVSVFDAELGAGLSEYSGATITLTRHGSTARRP